MIFIQTCFAQTKWLTDSLSVFNERMRIAKISNDRKTILQTYSSNIFSSTTWTSKEDSQRVTRFFRQGIDFAIITDEYDNEVIGYIRLACIFRKRSEADEAIKNALFATANIEQIKSDSIKVIAYIELSDCYQLKKEPVKACINFNKAFDLALKSENHSLESNIVHRLANLYYLQGDTVEAINQIYKSVAINRLNKSGEGLIKDYTELARITDSTVYIDTVFFISDSLGLKDKIFNAKLALLNIYSFKKKNPEKALNYINSEKDIKDILIKKGIEYYHYYLGQLYHTCNMADSGLYYLKMAQPLLLPKLNVSIAINFYKHMAGCYKLKNNLSNAIYFYEKMLANSREVKSRSDIALASDSLSKLYSQTKKFEKAYESKLLATEMVNSLAISAKEKDLVLLEMYRETKKHEEELRQHEEDLHKKHNLQYLGITIGICILFLCFLILGMFPVSKLVIKIFGYIYFICVFEFIVLLIEHSVLHPITHGDPLKLWSLKIVLIALLVPVQQFLEHRLIHFLQSRKLHQARTKFLAEAWGKKKPVPQPESDAEIEPGVL